MEASNIIQLGLWGDDKLITVPKKHLTTIPDWAQVAMSGWRKGWERWLRFWGIDRIRRVHTFSNSLDSPVAGSVPGYIERQALKNLSEEAVKMCTANSVYRLSIIDKTLIALERYYMAHYHTFEFRATYHQFIKSYIPPTANLEITHRYLWVADRMGMYRSVASDEDKNHIVHQRPATQSVVDMLSVASARLELLEKWGNPIDLSIDIRSLLRVQKRRAA